MEYLENKQKPGLLMLIDFEKAFDSISWKFMYNVLKFLGFPSDYINWIFFFFFFFLLYIFYLPFLYNIYTAPWKGEGSKPFIRGLQQIFIHSIKYSKKDKDVTMIETL